MADEPESFDIRETAAFLAVHEQTVRKLARRGAIPAFKVGKDWRFRRVALLRWIEEQQPSRPGCSALVVDDEELICRTLRRMLEGFGCRVRQATRAGAGLDLVAEEPPDIILLDLKMPDMNGPTFLEKLRASHPDLPVVIVTGYPDSELMTQAMQHPPLMMLAKPVDQEQLERTVRSVLGDRMKIARGGISP